VTSEHQIFLDGSWQAPVRPNGGIPVVNPATGAQFSVVPACSPEDADRAVTAASRAFGAWSHSSKAERLALLDGLADAVSARAAEFESTITSELGVPVATCRPDQVDLGIQALTGARQVLAELGSEERVGNSVIRREPIGVAACITPWNYPLYQIALKVGAAFAAGCTVVLKPSELTSLTALLFARCIDDAGYPPGVFNVVTGSGTTVGEAVVSHQSVDMVSFTGSTVAGSRVASMAGAGIKKVCLELGGKSASVVLEDADIGAAVQHCIARCFENSGQSCSALTRLVVPRHLLPTVEEIAAASAERLRVGDPSDPTTDVGPLISQRQRERVLAYIESGLAEGAKLLCGGTRRPDDLALGYFVAPTVFTTVEPSMRLAREEIFGPVLSIMGYGDVDEAVAIANATSYGLSAAVWSADVEHAVRVAARLQAGQVSINGGGYNYFAPFGGYKQSGLGRESGRYGVEEFLEVKALNFPR
jgi:acyl-CoA reductase-like NAD-dependent aldehyde dehydrogenase